MLNPSDLTHAGIRGISPYQPGKPTEELERELGISNAIKLASNENPIGPSPKVQAALSQLIGGIALYPDANGYYLKEKLSAYWDISPSQITLGNGSNDVLDIIARVFAKDGDEVIFSQYGFLVYLLVTKAVNAIPVEVPARDFGHDLDAMYAAITDKTRLIFIANPNNPTGTYLKPGQLRAFLDKVPSEVLVVMDEAYQEYIQADDFTSTIKWVSEYPNLIVTKTFSKAYGLAGLRIGYSVSSPEVADLMNRVRQPFNVNIMALKAAEVALGDEEYLKDVVALNNSELSLVSERLKQMGFDCIPSSGNFVCFDVGEDARLCNEFLLRQGVIVRPVANYKMPRHLRVTIGLPEQNQKFLKAMELFRCQ